MTELDDLRRVAYGRTSSPAEETAAAAARAQLATHERRSLQVRAEREAAEFVRACGIDVHAPAESEAPGGVTVDVVEVYDDPGYLRRLGATWRVWAVPAFAAFVVGVMLTVASALLVLNAETRAGVDGVVSEGERLPADPPGNLELASALLASAQSSEDIPPVVEDSLEARTTHALRSTSDNLVFAAMSTRGDICLMMVDATVGATMSTCSPPSSFAKTGIWLGTTGNGVDLKLHWDGVTVTESRSPQ
jgi:hypothetical protein